MNRDVSAAKGHPQNLRRLAGTVRDALGLREVPHGLFFVVSPAGHHRSAEVKLASYDISLP
jgi:hypothetical protein